MSYNTPWPRVYPDLSKLDAKDIRRLTIEFPKSDADTILACTLNNSIFSLICQRALKDAADFIRSNNLTYATDSSRFVDAVCQRTTYCPVEKAVAPDVSGRVESVHVGVADAAEVSAGAGKKVTSGGKGRRGK